jgi:hypothetical protein
MKKKSSTPQRKRCSFLDFSQTSCWVFNQFTPQAMIRCPKRCHDCYSQICYELLSKRLTKKGVVWKPCDSTSSLEQVNVVVSCKWIQPSKQVTRGLPGKATPAGYIPTLRSPFPPYFARPARTRLSSTQKQSIYIIQVIIKKGRSKYLSMYQSYVCEFKERERRTLEDVFFEKGPKSYNRVLQHHIITKARKRKETGRV